MDVLALRSDGQLLRIARAGMRFAIVNDGPVAAGSGNLRFVPRAGRVAMGSCVRASLRGRIELDAVDAGLSVAQIPLIRVPSRAATEPDGSINSRPGTNRALQPGSNASSER